MMPPFVSPDSLDTTGNWWKDAIFYHMYPLGLCGAPFKNDFSLPVQSRLAELSSTRWLNHLQDELHVNAVYIGPLFESSTHGYDTIDFCKVDTRLGTNKDFRELVDAYHARGIRVIVDAVFNHVGKEFFAFQDVLKNREKSAYTSWFAGLKFTDKSHGDGVKYDSWAGVQSLVKLNVLDSNVQNYIFSAVKTWKEEWGIDGLRLDAADVVDKRFWKELRKDCAKYEVHAGGSFFLLGEITHGSCQSWVAPGMFHSITNYEAYKGLFSSHNDGNLFEIAHTFERLFGNRGLADSVWLYNFADNHDVNRIGSTINDLRHLSTLYMLLYVMPGIPSIYYGSEYSILGQKTHGYLADVPLRPTLDLQKFAALSASPPPPTSEEDNACSRALLSLLEHLGRIRCSPEGKALREGSFANLSIQNTSLTVKRQLGSESVILTVNITATPLSAEIPVTGQIVRDLMNTGMELTVPSDGKLMVTVPPYWGRLLFCQETSSSTAVSSIISTSRSLDASSLTTCLASAKRPLPEQHKKAHHHRHHHGHASRSSSASFQPSPDEVSIVLPAVGSAYSPRSQAPPVAVPSWAAEALFYHINALGQCGAPQENPLGAATVVHRLRQTLDAEWVEHLYKMGVTAVCVGPLLQSKSHGFDPLDLRTIDGRLGDEDSFKDVVEKFHEKGIKVVLDVGGLNKLFKEAGGECRQEALKQQTREVFKHWVDVFGVDGVRIDAADQLKNEIWSSAAQYCKEERDDFLFIGDVHGDYLRWCSADLFHTVTNYEIVKNMWSALNSSNLFEIIHNLQRQSDPSNGVYRDINLYCFVDSANHDRSASVVKPSELLPVLYIMLLTIPGIPSIYYGSEFGVKGKKLHHSAYADQPIRPAINLRELLADPPSPETLSVCQRLGLFRKSSEGTPLRRGTFTPCVTQNLHAVYSRQDGDSSVYIAINISDQPLQSVTLENLAVQEGQLTDYLDPHKLSFPIHNGKVSFSVSPYYGRVLVVKKDT